MTRNYSSEYIMLVSTAVASTSAVDRESITLTNDGDWDGTASKSLESVICMVFYAAIFVIFVMIIALIVKLLRSMDGGDDAAAASEITGLLPPKEEIQYSWYGTNEAELESGTGGCSSTSCLSSYDELYDATICVICYDDRRSCFFNPCGHCVTCHTCATRIVNEENKSCPICRTFINSVMKLHLLSLSPLYCPVELITHSAHTTSKNLARIWLPD